MTEAEWLTSDDPQPMGWFLWASHRDVRKPRLFSGACRRRIWDSLVDPLFRRAVVDIELEADGGTPSESLEHIGD